MSDEQQQPPQRPDHADYFALSDSVITIDRQVEGMIEAGANPEEMMNEMIGKFIDIPSVDYAAMERIEGIVAKLGFPTNMMVMQIGPLVAGIWQDGFLAAQMFNERKVNGLMTVPDTLEGLDGL